MRRSQRMATKEAYDLFHQGSIALAGVESHGIRVDLDYLRKTIDQVSTRINTLESDLKKDDLWKRWKRKFRERTKFGSREQLGEILFRDLKYPVSKYTESSYNDDGSLKDNPRPSVDESHLEKIDHPFVKSYLQVERLRKLRSTNLEGILREQCDGYLHPVFNLASGDDDKGGARTYRSSSSLINFQNIPVRNPELAGYIRPAFIARPGHQLVEVDYAGIEVRIAACYHKDPTMIRYIEDKSTDMHRDMAAEIYLIRTDQVSKHARYGAKNMFVFPVFYGSFYVDCAKNLWEWMDRSKLIVEGVTERKKVRTENGIGYEEHPLLIRKHLKRLGISELGACNEKARPLQGTFEFHIKKVEDAFWNKRFPVYRDWKRTWFEQYQRLGGFMMHTGFWVSGVMRRNEVINYPVQGAAFHCLLWSLIRLQNEMKRRKMKSILVGQIHDSLLADVHQSERDDFLQLAKQVMTQDLPKAWKWINVPLEIEAEVSPPGGTWNDKKGMPIP